MTQGQFSSAAQSLLHYAGAAAVTLATVNPQWGNLAQLAVGAAGAGVALIGGVWSFLTPPAPK